MEHICPWAINLLLLPWRLPRCGRNWQQEILLELLWPAPPSKNAGGLEADEWGAVPVDEQDGVPMRPDG